MLRAEECVVGSFPEADTDRLTLLLPRRSSEEMILITGAAGEKIAIFLGEHKYHAFACGDSEAWKGLLIAGVRVELDETSLFTPGYEAPPGAVVREGTGFSITAKMRDSHGFDRSQPIALGAGLAACRERESAGFHKWQIVLGEGPAKQVLMTVDVSPKTTTVSTA